MWVLEFRTLRRWVVIGAVVLAACGDEATAPGRDPEIINATDNFQYQITDIQGFSGAHVYSWQNTGTIGTVNQSTTVTAGAATLIIRDANGTQVYNRSLAENGTFSSSAGTAGTWTVRVVYVNADATVNFRVDKGP